MLKDASEHELEQALSLKATQEGQWSAIADGRYEANTGMFGGWTAAILLRAVILDERSVGVPTALTVNYVNRIIPGCELKVCVFPRGGGRSISHWQVEISLADDDLILAYASVVMARRRPGDGFVEGDMPVASPPEALDVFSPPGSFGERTEIRAVSGFPPFQQPNSISLAWVKEQSGRPMDPVQLAYLADVYPPRIWYGGSDPRLSATITMSVYFHATQEEMDIMDDDYVLTRASGTRGVQSTVGSQAKLWSPAGALLATTEQICWFK